MVRQLPLKADPCAVGWGLLVLHYIAPAGSLRTIHAVDQHIGRFRTRELGKNQA